MPGGEVPYRATEVPRPHMDRIHVYPYPNTFRDFGIRAPDADGQEGGDEDKPDIVPGQ